MFLLYLYRLSYTVLTVFLLYWFSDVLVLTFSILSRRARKSGEKNVKAVKKSEEVEGYEGDKDVNTLLRVSPFHMLDTRRGRNN